MKNIPSSTCSPTAKMHANASVRLAADYAPAPHEWNIYVQAANFEFAMKPYIMIWRETDGQWMYTQTLLTQRDLIRIVVFRLYKDITVNSLIPGPYEVLEHAMSITTIGRPPKCPDVATPSRYTNASCGPFST